MHTMDYLMDALEASKKAVSAMVKALDYDPDYYDCVSDIANHLLPIASDLQLTYRVLFDTDAAEEMKRLSALLYEYIKQEENKNA